MPSVISIATYKKVQICSSIPVRQAENMYGVKGNVKSSLARKEIGTNSTHKIILINAGRKKCLID